MPQGAPHGGSSRICPGLGGHVCPEPRESNFRSVACASSADRDDSPSSSLREKEGLSDGREGGAETGRFFRVFRPPGVSFAAILEDLDVDLAILPTEGTEVRAALRRMFAEHLSYSHADGFGPL